MKMKTDILARIEENRSMLEMAKLHMDGRTCLVLQERIIALERQLKTIPSLTEIGIKHQTDKATYHGFTDFYERELSGFVPRRILEIGVKHGASLKMWREYYPNAEVVEGWDINEPIVIEGCVVRKVDCDKGYDIITNSNAKTFDLIIDDGSHKFAQQKLLFSILYPKLSIGGFYIVEDLHTSFRDDFKEWEAGVLKPSTYQFLKSLEDEKKISCRLWAKELTDISDSLTCVIKKTK